MLEVSQVSRSYGDIVAVNNVSFAIDGNAIVGLLGHNGAGKTTIMKMISGYLEPDRGRISLNGYDVCEQRRLAQAAIGYLPENLPVYPELTVADYLDYAATLKGLQGAAKNRELRAAVSATDIGARAGAPIGTLSRGYKQRVGVAQALLGRPQLLILDEPTNGLDPTQTAQMRKLIRDCARSATVILSTHIMQEVDALCDRVLILRDGKLAVDAGLAELRASNELQIECSLPVDELRRQLRSIPGCGEVTSAGRSGADGHARVALTSNDKVTAQRAAAAVARSIAAAGGELYTLRPAGRDLETLFRETTSAAAAGADAHGD